MTDIVKYLRLTQTRFNRHTEAADEIARLRALADQLADALDISCQMNRTAVKTIAYYPQHAKDALARHKEVRGD